MSQPLHILNKEGVLVSFSIAKRLSEKDVEKFIAAHRKKNKKLTDEELMDLLQKKVTEEIQKSVENDQIPGIVDIQTQATDAGLPKNVVDSIPELNRIVSVIFQKLSNNKKYDKMTLCYFINCLVNILQLEEEDFIKFHELNDSDDDDGDDDEFQAS